MLKPTKTYKMSALLKTSLATTAFKDAHHRGAWKRAMIDAELCAAIVPKTVKTDRGAPRGNTAYVTNDTGTASTQSE
jgi:hypothetical protein